MGYKDSSGSGDGRPNMFDSRDRTIDPRFGVNVPSSDGHWTEPAKRFRFGITWTSLTDHLELGEAIKQTSSTARQSAPEMKETSLAAVADIAVPPIRKPETRSDSDVRWEMVVPKMVRSDRGSNSLITAGNRNGDMYPPISVPTLTHLENARPALLSRALAAIERCTGSILSGPRKPIDTTPISFLDAGRLALANGRSSRLQVLQLNAPSFPISSENQIAKIENIQDRHVTRELLLAKITGKLLSRSRSVDPRIATNHKEEQWSKAPVGDESGIPYSV
jgi:hypothetical protein